MVNAKHDTAFYESCGYQRDIYDANALYEAYLRARKGSDWKPQVQKYGMTYLLHLSKMQRELAEQSYNFSPSNEFVLNERGKTRYISGEVIADRIVKHSLCDEVLMPAVKKYLIYDNGASQTGKGIDFTRQRLLTHLHKYYRQNGSNAGYILLIDFTKYYDNIRHDIMLDIFEKIVDDPHALWLLKIILSRSRVDVSYMSDEEYANCMNNVFNSLEHAAIDKSLLTGEKFMNKHLNIGDQVAQIAGIAYPIRLDNYIKIVKGVKFYGRYMDDSYIIHRDKEYLQQLLKEIIEVAAQLGITINTRKTRICKLNDYWRFLQTQYSLTDTGRVIQKINTKRLTAFRRKLKKLARILPPKEFYDWYTSWYRSYYKIMSKKQKENLNSLFEELQGINREFFTLPKGA